MFERGYSMVGRSYSSFGGSLGHSTGFMYGGIGMLLIGAVVLIAVVVTIHFMKKAKTKQPNNEILESLKMRFINGEITEEEYTRMKTILSN